MNLTSSSVLQPAGGARRRRRLRSTGAGTAERMLTGDGLGPLALRTVLLSALGGALLGLCWWQLAPTAEVQVVAGGYYLTGDAYELEVGQDGWLAVLLGAAGLLVATVQSVRAREPQPLRSVLAASGVLFAAVLAWQVGQWCGPAPLADQVARSVAHPSIPLRLHTVAVLGVGPLLFAVTRCLGALFSAPVR